MLKKGIKLYDHQGGAIKHSSHSKRSLIALPTGCLGGDTEIRINLNGRGKKITIKDMYYRYNRIDTLNGGRYNWKENSSVKVRSYLGDKIGLNNVEDVVYSGQKYTIKLHFGGGTFLVCTPEHKIMTDTGWVEAKDMLHKKAMIDVNIKASSKNNKKVKYSDTFIRTVYHPYAKEINSTRDGKTCRIEKHRAIYEAKINLLSLEEYRCRMTTTADVSDLMFIDPKIYDIHHIDFDHYNNDPQNLTHLTKKQHRLIHTSQYTSNFNQGAISYDECINVEDNGVVDTYDISCETPHHNFTANGIVVHNSGKTLLAMIYFLKLKEMGVVNRCIFVCEKTTASQVQDTKDEFFDIDVRITNVVNMSAKKRHKAYKEDTDFIVINYQKLRNDIHHLMDIYHYNDVHLILDEATAVKNPKAQVTKVAQRMSESSTRLLAMTATPIMKELLDMYYILSITGIFLYNLGRFYGNFCTFEDIYVKPRRVRGKMVNKQKTLVGYRNIDEFYELFKDKLYTKKKSEIMDMPPFVPIPLKVTKDLNFGKAFTVLLEKYPDGVPSSLINIANTAPAVTIQEKLPTPTKIAELVKFIKESADEKVMVYTQFRTVAIYFETILNKREGIGAVSIHGGNSKYSAEIKKQFLTDDKIKVLVGTDSIAKGFDGVHKVADTIAFLTIPETVGQFIQIVGRISRIGTTFNYLNVVVPMVENSIDEVKWANIQASLYLLTKTNPDQVEEGLLDPKAKDLFEGADSDTWVKTKLSNMYKTTILK